MSENPAKKDAIRMISAILNGDPYINKVIGNLKSMLYDTRDEHSPTCHLLTYGAGPGVCDCGLGRMWKPPKRPKLPPFMETADGSEGGAVVGWTVSIQRKYADGKVRHTKYDASEWMAYVAALEEFAEATEERALRAVINIMYSYLETRS